MEKRTVLFVDDDPIALRSIARGFLDEPYNLCFAGSGEEALKILSQQEVHILVTDIRMPEMDGIELLEIVTEQYPHIVKMVLSGSTNSIELTKAIHQGGVFKFIPKPWNLQEGEKLREIVRCAIDHYNLKNEHTAKVQN